MRGKVARELRKIIGFDPRQKRTYHRTYLGTSKKRILQVDTTGNVTTVVRDVDREVIECIDGGRKVYQIMKRRFINPDYTHELVPLPSEEETNELRATKEAIDKQLSQEAVSQVNGSEEKK